VELDDGKADGNLRNQCLYPVQKLKARVETQTSQSGPYRAGRRQCRGIGGCMKTVRRGNLL
jgi:hypothetical protein